MSADHALHQISLNAHESSWLAASGNWASVRSPALTLSAVIPEPSVSIRLTASKVPAYTLAPTGSPLVRLLV